MRVTPILFVFLAANAFATISDGRSNDPSRLGFADTAAFRSIVERVEQLPSPATDKADDRIQAQSTGLSASRKARIAMWTSSANLPKAETLVAVPPRIPSNAELVIEEIVPEVAPSEVMTARTVRYASIDDDTQRRHVSKHKGSRRQSRSMPNPSAVDDQAEPSLLQKIFGALFQGD